MKKCYMCKTEKDDSEFWKNQLACKKCQKEYRRLYRDPQRGRDLAWNRNLLKYGMTIEEYQQRHAAQGGVCAICKNPDVVRLAVDHCHKTNRIRGLLCKKCNMGIGLLQDSPEVLQAAFGYLTAQNG